ncbi:MAG: GTP-binding protein [Actinobacteria bacterium]|nr:GTP-binding protein [Actinomycetota bacterium]
MLDRRVTPTPPSRDRLDMVVVGHVDHGKSTLIGRLMADTGSLPEGKLEQVRAMCERNARPFEYAFLLDALKDERAQGITIDTARCFFRTPARDFVIHDAPGHIEFVKNMVTGAARAQAALLLIDAQEGIQENSRRHGYILSMLGIGQIAVVVNKMDLVAYDETVFERIVAEYREFLGRFNVTPIGFIPVAARAGVNIAEKGTEMPWYEGPTVLEQIDAFQTADERSELPFRMPVQDVYKFTAAGDDRRIVAGTVETGRLALGEEVVFWPSAKRSRVATIEALTAPPARLTPDLASGITLETQVYVRRGELMTRADDPAPSVARRVRANVLWLGHAPLVPGKNYLFKLGAAKVPAELVELRCSIDASDLVESQATTTLERHAIGEVVLEFARPVAFDPAGLLEPTSRFVIVDNYDIAGFGTVLEGLTGDESMLERHAREREAAWERGEVAREEREERYGHEGKAVVIVGSPEAPARPVARALERRLFEAGAHVYMLLLSEKLAGFDPLHGDVIEREEHLRRLGELSRLMTDAGTIFVTALDGMDAEDLERLRVLNAPSSLLVVSTLPNADSLDADITLAPGADLGAAVTAILRGLAAVGAAPEYWI